MGTKRKKGLKRPVGTQRICAVWTSIAEYMAWYEEWVKTCAELDPRWTNPNRALAERGRP